MTCPMCREEGISEPNIDHLVELFYLLMRDADVSPHQIEIIVADIEKYADKAPIFSSKAAEKAARHLAELLASVR